MESYRTEEEQVEALRRWWNDNGRSTLFAIVVVLAGTFGWQGWQRYEAQRNDNASDLYQQMLEAASMAAQGVVNDAPAGRIASQLRSEYGGTTYARFAALHQARMAVAGNDLDAAEDHLRWVLGKARSGSDTAMVAQLRLARVLAAKGETEQALKLLTPAGSGTFRAASALARGDVMAAAGRDPEALSAYREAQALVQQYPGQLNLATLEAKIQNLAAAGGEAGA